MGIPTVVGLLGPSLTSLHGMFKALLSSEPWLHDPEVLPLPYRSQEELVPERIPKLSFGLLASDGIVTPHPPIVRAIQEVTEALEADGHSVGQAQPLKLEITLTSIKDYSVGASLTRGILPNSCIVYTEECF